jgi:hypothetical protein
MGSTNAGEEVRGGSMTGAFWSDDHRSPPRERCLQAGEPPVASVSIARLDLEPHHAHIVGLALLASGLLMAGVGYL